MNTLFFSGKLIADARVNKGEKGNFISMTMYETGKGKDAPKIEVTQNFKGDDAPSIVEFLKQYATVIVSGTPYAKIGKDIKGISVPVMAMFADKIDIVAFANSKEKTE